MLTLRGRRILSYVQAVLWCRCIGELGLDYQCPDAGHRYGVTDTSAFLAMNSNGTIPVLRDGFSEPLWETGAISLRRRFQAARGCLKRSMRRSAVLPRFRGGSTDFVG